MTDQSRAPVPGKSILWAGNVIGRGPGGCRVSELGVQIRSCEWAVPTGPPNRDLFRFGRDHEDVIESASKHNHTTPERDCPTDPAARSLSLVFESARVRQALEALVEETP